MRSGTVPSGVRGTEVLLAPGAAPAETQREEVADEMMQFRRRDAFWEMDGKAARNARRRHQLVASLAFMTAVAATAGAATMWWLQTGVGTLLHARLGIL